MFKINTIPDKFYNRAKKLYSKDFNQKLSRFINLIMGTKYGDLTYNHTGNSSEKILDNLTLKSEFKYDFNEFNCVTFIETALALSFAANKGAVASKKEFQEDFEKHLKAIRYKHGIDNYINRNHFVSGDSVPNNFEWQQEAINNKKFTNIPKGVAIAEINRMGCIIFKELPKLKENKIDMKKNNLLLKTTVENNVVKQNLKKRMQEYGIPVKITETKLPYFKINDLLDSSNTKDPDKNFKALCNGIKDVSIINIVAPGWDLKKYVNSELNISHQGFLTKEKGELFFTHATSVGNKKVTRVLLKDYLSKLKNHKIKKGINIQTIYPEGMAKHLKLCSDMQKKLKWGLKDEKKDKNKIKIIYN